MTTIIPPKVTEAVALMRAGNKGQAVDLLRQVVREHPDCVPAWLYLGGLTPDPDEGRCALESALRLEPTNEIAQRAMAWLTEGRPAQTGETGPTRGAPDSGAAPAAAATTIQTTPVSEVVMPQESKGGLETPSAAAGVPDTAVDTASAAVAPVQAGELGVMTGSAYLSEQEQDRAKRRRSIARPGLVVSVVAIVATVSGIALHLMGATSLVVWGLLVGSLGLVALVGLLVPVVERLGREEDHYAAGRRGEEALARVLAEHLDGEWTLFRNVVLPRGSGDIDAILTGPRGIYALEVKAYRGYYRNRGNSWERRAGGQWGAVDHQPGRQARQNAARLHRYLAERGMAAWVEARVVWAGDSRLWVERPAVRVWQLRDPRYMVQDIESGKVVPPALLDGVNADLAAHQRQTTTPGG